MTDKTTIKTDIIRFIESKGHASKSQICDHLRDSKGTLGETTGRRIRELIETGIIEKFKLETPFLQNPYFTYRVKPLEAKSPQKKALDTIFNQLIDMKKHECHKPYIPQEEKLNL